MYCPSCGTTMAADDRFCLYCGDAPDDSAATRLSPTAHAETYMAAASTPPPYAAAPPHLVPTYAVNATSPEPARKRPTWPFGVAAGLIIAGLMVGGWWLLDSRGDTAAEPVSANTPVATTTSAPTTGGVSGAPTAAPATEPGDTVYVERPRTVTVSRQPDRTVYVGPDAPEVPGGEGDGGLAGSWVTVLESLPQSSNSYAYAERRAAALSRSGAPIPFVLDSSVAPGLRSGYWAVVVGPYVGESAARSQCSSFGRSPGGTCYPRHLE